MGNTDNLTVRVSRLAPLVDVANELPEVLTFASSHPANSLSRARVILERLLKAVARFEGLAVPPRAMVGELLSPKMLGDRLPDLPLAEMQYVNRVASSGGPHDGPADSATAARVLDHLCCALEWYEYQYLPSGLTDNFGVPLRSGESLVAYVSTGGTCRCAMANVITRHYVQAGSFRFMSLALHPPSSPNMSVEAVQILRERLDIDATDHRTVRADERYFRRATTLLAMDEKLLKQFPPSATPRTVLFSEFYGGHGGVIDPFGRGLEAYRACFETIHPLIANGFQRF